MTPPRGRRVLAASVTMTLSVVAHAQSAGAELVPAWTYPLAAGVEWVEPVAAKEAEALLLATPAGALHVLDPATGQMRLTAPIEAAPGVRLVRGQHPSDTAFCFDRYSAYAIRIAAPAHLVHQLGGRSAQAADFPGDPEVLSSWQHAVVTHAGDLLLVNTDGRVALWSPTDATETWVTHLDPLPIARLHVRAETAVVLSKTGGRVRAAFVRLAERPPAVRTRELGPVWPVWSTLVAEGLLTVTSSEAALWPDAGPPRMIPLGPVELRATAIAVDADAARGARLLVLDGHRLVTFDLAAGRRTATQSVGPVHGTPSLAVTGDCVVLADERGVALHTMTDGTPLVRQAVDGERLLGWHVARATRLYTLGERAVGPATTLCLGLIELTASQPVTQPASTTEFRLRDAGRPRRVAWTDTHLILVESDGLRAYKLP